MLNLERQLYNQAGATYIEGAKLVTSQNNQFSFCYVSEYGSMIYLVSVIHFTDYASNFEGGAAIQGGAIACDNCNMTLTNSYFQNFTAQNGGTLLLLNSASMNMQNVAILDSLAIS